MLYTDIKKRKKLKKKKNEIKNKYYNTLKEYDYNKYLTEKRKSKLNKLSNKFFNSFYNFS